MIIDSTKIKIIEELVKDIFEKNKYILNKFETLRRTEDSPQGLVIAAGKPGVKA